MTALAIALSIPACTDSPRSFGDEVADPDVPPRGEGDIDGWIAVGHYVSWRCEPAPVDVRLGSPHRPQTRTCSNVLIVDGTGEFPVGAASVKEMFDDAGQIMGYGVSRKVAAGGADGWYWYEKTRGRVLADGMGPPAGSCSGCHSGAARDFTWVVVP
ncbi:MAG: hypothetical protein H0T89_07815 [Deltaproteobacteria bacterium]|nr:hypothetical protein [Deltaproteobacteria bacterium]MDQ3297045.1 hypothetical protein [Myxococcota bacterium]